MILPIRGDVKRHIMYLHLHYNTAFLGIVY